MQTPKTQFLTKLAHFFSFLLHHHLRLPKRSPIHDHSSTFHFLSHRSDLQNQVLIFHAETAILRSPSLFPYFLLVAFEAGSLIRALVLLLLYPFIALLREDLAIRAMVMVSFFGLKKEGFLEGSAVLPKYFLEDVGKESFEVLRRGKTRVAVSELPRVMVEGFLVDYLEVDVVVGRELKVWCGYFVGLMEGRKEEGFEGVEMSTGTNAVGVGCFRKGFDCRWFSNCKEIYLVSEQERSKWQQLPKDSYPKPLIFHDGRLAFRPTFMATLAMFIWLPVGFTLAILRLIIALTFPSPITIPTLHLTGARIHCYAPPSSTETATNRLFVCNHRTLLDPLIISYCLKAPLTAVVYSLSRVSEILSPIRTVRLTRSRERDAELMRELLRQGDLVVCPEGTTCREPYLLRFSPLFTEIKDQVFPVAMTYDVSMFYGTTARGFKSLDSLFFLMNPWPSCSVRFLEPVGFGSGGSREDDAGALRCKRANMVQQLIAQELGFTCTRLTRKDKYLILAGNDGIVKCSKKQ